jgi:two-component system nitrate/nitrite response regulator NarL
MRRRAFATVLVGQSALLREGLARILSAADFRIVGSGARVQDVIRTSQHQSLLLIIDVGYDPEAAVAEIELFKEQHPSGRVAVLADRYPLPDMVSAFVAGANLYFANSVSCDALIKALELVMLGETILPPQLFALIAGNKQEREGTLPISQRVHGDASQRTRTDDTPRLSAREKSILRRMVDGDSNKVIARKIDITEATVKVHVKGILRKIRVHNRTQAAIWAMNNGVSLWPDNPCPQTIVDVSSPPALVPDSVIEQVQSPSPEPRGNRASVASVTDISVARKNSKPRDRAVGS